MLAGWITGGSGGRSASCASGGGSGRPTSPRLSASRSRRSRGSSAGRLDGVTMGSLERVFAELGIRNTLADMVGRRGARPAARRPPLGDARCHRADVRVAARVDDRARGLVRDLRERGVIDILAWHAASRTLLVIELKTELVDVQETVGTLDRKRRLAAQVAAERGWKPAAVSVWLVIADSRTNQRRVAAHRAMLRAAYPVDGRTIGRWLQAPSGAIAALSFLPSTRGTSANREFAPVRRVSGRRPSVDPRR